MAREIRPASNYKIRESGERVTLSVRRRRPIWMMFMTLVSIPPALVAALSGIAYLQWQKLEFGISFMVSMFAFVLALMLASKKATDRVSFGKTGVTKGGRLYKYDSINSVGYKNPFTFVEGRVADVARVAGFMIYIVYGTKEVPLIRGLTESEATVIYREVQQLFERFGQSYS